MGNIPEYNCKSFGSINTESVKEYNIDKNTLSKAIQCLADNGIEPDECCTVLQAICYILLGIEIEDYIPEGTLPGESF